MLIYLDQNTFEDSLTLEFDLNKCNQTAILFLNNSKCILVQDFEKTKHI